jgi:hypothetical protein
MKRAILDVQGGDDMSETLRGPRRLKFEPDEDQWAGSEVSEDELVDDDWIAENTKEVTDDGLDESDSSESS